MTEEYQSQLAQFEECLNNTFGKMVAKYAVRITWMVIVLSFAAGGWAAKLQLDMSAIRAAQVETKVDVKEMKATMESGNVVNVARLVEWSQWRVLKDSMDDSYERRLAWIESVERGRRP